MIVKSNHNLGMCRLLAVTSVASLAVSLTAPCLAQADVAPGPPEDSQSPAAESAPSVAEASPPAAELPPPVAGPQQSDAQAEQAPVEPEPQTQPTLPEPQTPPDAPETAPPPAKPRVGLTSQITCAESASYTPNPGDKTGRRLVLKSQHIELGGDMVFITSDQRVDASGRLHEPLAFTDVGLLRLRARRSFSDWFELYAATSVLAKQPTAWDEAIWQGARGGARLAFADHFAFRLGAAGGRLFETRGHYWQAEPELQLKADVDQLLRFELGLGSTTTVMNASTNAAALWLSEVNSHAEMQFGSTSGAFWVGLDYAVPIASGPNASAPDETSGRFLEPPVRLGLQVGGVLSVSEAGWDAFAVYNVVDRGELDRPETTLPILDGGFDQTQIILGVQHRFDSDPCTRICGRCVDE